MKNSRQIPTRTCRHTPRRVSLPSRKIPPQHLTVPLAFHPDRIPMPAHEHHQPRLRNPQSILRVHRFQPASPNMVVHRRHRISRQFRHVIVRQQIVRAAPFVLQPQPESFGQLPRKRWSGTI